MRCNQLIATLNSFELLTYWQIIKDRRHPEDLIEDASPMASLMPAICYLAPT
uniref:Uncharacterized protein n=1 Tax=Candidatus Nitrotoga fabula TaxID=2182327 RepID=A0A2X0QTE4_9PROT|nr:protein of unknown function [Candidatus Nitrotoga fabula]